MIAHLLRQLIHTQDSNDILEGLVVLQQLLHTSGNIVVLVADDIGVHNSGGGVKRVQSGVDSSLGDRSEQIFDKG